ITSRCGSFFGACGYELHSTPRILHWLCVRFLQFSIAATAAASCVGRVAPPQTLPSSFVAIAPQRRGPTRNTILHVCTAQDLSAASSALDGVCWFELWPYLPPPSSRANAPKSPPSASADDDELGE